MTLCIAALVAAFSLPPRLETMAKDAYADIGKAKAALDAGKSQTGQTWLAKAEGLLKAVLAEAPGASAPKKTDQTPPAAQPADAGPSQSAASQAEAQAAKVDPSLGAQLGIAKETAAPGDGGAFAQARSAVAGKLGLGGLEDVLQKVSSANALLKSGETTKAKSLLDQIPSLGSLKVP